MKKASFILGILYTPCAFAVTLTTTCPSGYKTINRPEFRLATTCDSSEKSIGTISTCLTDSPAAVILGDDDPSVQMQRLMKQMGGEMPEVKPLLEINPDSPVIARIEASDDEDFVAAMSSVILDQALLQEGVMPSDPAAFAANLTKLLS